jgi:hypothetical protein
MSVSLHLRPRGEETPIPWPSTPDAVRARAYLEPILREGTSFVAPNLEADLGVAIVDGEVVPYTVSREAEDQSYVVSPFTHYITYGAEEIGKLETPALEAPLRAVVAGLGRAFRRAGFDRVVYVDNWLTSTTLHAPMPQASWAALLGALRTRHPDHAIVVRGVDARASPALRASLLALEAELVFSRRVLFQDPRETLRRRDAIRDKALLDRALSGGRYRAVDARSLDHVAMARATELYDRLYVIKWSRHNPQLTTRYVAHALRTGFLEGKALVSREGSIDGVYAAWIRHGLYYVPLLGYDTGLPRSLGLYRMLAALSSGDALARGVLVHDSAGVSDFKQNRGAVPVLEHLAVFDRHLPRSRRAPWRALRVLMDRVGVPLIERFDL